MSTSLDRLVHLIAGLEQDADDDVVLQSANWEEDGLTLRVSIHPYQQASSYWEILCRSVYCCELKKIGSITPWSLTSEHPLTLTYRSRNVELYFRGRPKDLSATVGGLLKAHRELMGDWVAFQEFFNSRYQGSWHELLASGDGLLAEGPEPLINGYSGVLQSQGVATSLISPPVAISCNGSNWIKTPLAVQVLTFGKSYVVAGEFSAKEVPLPPNGSRD